MSQVTPVSQGERARCGPVFPVFPVIPVIPITPEPPGNGYSGYSGYSDFPDAEKVRAALPSRWQVRH